VVDKVDRALQRVGDVEVAVLVLHDVVQQTRLEGLRADVVERHLGNDLSRRLHYHCCLYE